MSSGGSVYILTNKNLSTLYTGSTTDIIRRYDEYLNHYYPNAFSARYRLYRLVFVMYCDCIYEARELEYFIKGKLGQWKINLIEKGNPFCEISGVLLILKNWKIIMRNTLSLFFEDRDSAPKDYTSVCGNNWRS